MTKISHGPEHYREHRIRASETGLIVKHYRILPEDKEAVDELVRPFKERADAHFRRVRREQRAEERKREAEEMKRGKAASAHPPLESKPSTSSMDKPTLAAQKPAEEPKNTLRPIQKKRSTLTLNFRKAS